MKTALSYGTFDLIHYGHLRLLEYAASIADIVIVGVSTDCFKINKNLVQPYWQRSEMVRAIRYVTTVIPEHCEEQKFLDIKRFNVDYLVLGEDWLGHPLEAKMREIVELKTLPRTPDLSTSLIKTRLT